jgi:hypothetical protein
MTARMQRAELQEGVRPNIVPKDKHSVTYFLHIPKFHHLTKTVSPVGAKPSTMRLLGTFHIQTIMITS